MLAVLSLFLVHLALLGWACTAGVRGQRDPFAIVGLALGAGLLVNLALMLAGSPIPLVLAAGAVIGLVGAWRAVTRVRAKVSRWTVRGGTTAAAALAGGILFLYYVQILSEPLSRWDARSIWFFHARMIWIEGGLGGSSVWTHPSIAFSHPDYPKLVPATAAQLGYLSGYWNEYMPKGALFVLLVPAVCWVFSVRRARPAFLVLVLLLLFGQYGWLSNGYMDGYLVLYAGLALVLLGRYLSEGRDADLCAGACAMGIAASLKNEGLLFAVAMLAALLCTASPRDAFGLRPFAARLRRTPPAALVLLLAAAPALLWAVRTRAWGLRSDVAGDPGAAIARAAGRLVDGASAQYILTHLTVEASDVWVPALLTLVLIVGLRLLRVPVPRAACVAALAAVIYFAGLYAVYLSTPYDLGFHLPTSAGRTVAVARIALFVSVYFLLSAAMDETPSAGIAGDPVVAGVESAHDFPFSRSAARHP